MSEGSNGENHGRPSRAGGSLVVEFRQAGRIFGRGGEAAIMDIIYFIGAVVVWFVLIKWVLPRFGVAT